MIYMILELIVEYLGVVIIVIGIITAIREVRK